MSSRAVAWRPVSNVGLVLTTDAPTAYVRTQGPTFENSAVLCAPGSSAPTEMSFGKPSEGMVAGAPGHGQSAAGKAGRAVASLPADVTTTQPRDRSCEST